jgi:hypothetical protein
MLEEMMLKALDEREDLKGKLIAQDKEIAEMKVEQEKVLNDLTAVEEQRLRLRKAIEERREKVANSLTSKEPALKPGILEKVNEVAEKLDLSDLKGEAKVGKEPEHLVQSEEKGLKQNINLDTYLSAVSVNSPLQVNPVVGLSMYQYSTPNYGHQPLLHSSPYFCKCLCVCYYHPCSEMQNVDVIYFNERGLGGGGGVDCEAHSKSSRNVAISLYYVKTMIYKLNRLQSIVQLRAHICSICLSSCNIDENLFLWIACSLASAFSLMSSIVAK